MRDARPFRMLPNLKRPTRLGSLASLTASLLLGACSQTGGALMTNLTAAPTETGATDTTPAAPQTELQKATTYWGQEYAKKPTDLKAAISYAKNLKAMGEKQKALTVLQQASVFHGSDKELASEYGRLALELDQVSAANQLLAIADDPTKPDWRVLSARGTVLAKQGKYSDAVPFYERALTLSDNNPSVLNNLAMAYAMMGDPKKAEDILRQATAKDGASPKVRENLALVLGLQGRYDESRSVASSVISPEIASANTDYIKQLVKLEPKSAPAPLPDFQTAVAAVAPAKPPVAAARTATPEFQTSIAAAPAQKDIVTGSSQPAAPASWQTNVAGTPSGSVH